MSQAVGMEVMYFYAVVSHCMCTCFTDIDIFLSLDIRGLLTDVGGKIPTPPTSYTGSPMPPSPSTSMEGSDNDPPSPGLIEDMDTVPTTTTTIQLPITAMTNGTRFSLCVFMLAVLAFNPFGSVLHASMKAAVSGDFAQQHGGGRMLMADGGLFGGKRFWWLLELFSVSEVTSYMIFNS